MPARKSFLLRMDRALWAELEAWAEAEFRSVNGQIEYLLQQAVQRRKRGCSGEAATAAPAEASPPLKPPEEAPQE